MDEKQRIVQEIRRVANSIAPRPLTKRTFLQEGTISFKKIRYHFGTWNRAVEAAGLKPNPSGVRVSGYDTIPEDELLQEIGVLWQRVGRKPTGDIMDSMGQFSHKPFRTRWGTFSKAVDEYVKRFGEPAVDTEAQTGDVPVVSRLDAPVIIPKTHKHSPTAKKIRPIFYGEPIDFQGQPFQGDTECHSPGSRTSAFMREGRSSSRLA